MVARRWSGMVTFTCSSSTTLSRSWRVRSYEVAMAEAYTLRVVSEQSNRRSMHERLREVSPHSIPLFTACAQRAVTDVAPELHALEADFFGYLVGAPLRGAYIAAKRGD